MIKVLVFGITDNPGGMESVIMNYYRHIDRTQVQFEFLCNTEIVAHEEEIKSLGGVVHRIPARSHGVSAFRKALRQFFDENGSRYAALWFNTISLANIDYLKEAARVGIPRRIIHCHNAANGDSRLRGILHKLNQKKALSLGTDYWTCSEDANAWFFGRDMKEYDSYRLIQNAIAIRDFVPDMTVRAQYRKELGIEDRLVIGHVGRFHFQKNQKFLIPVMKELKNRGSDAVLLFIGQGDEQEMVRQLAGEAGVLDMVRFLGVRSDVKQLLWASDVFVLPSLFEGLSIAVLEAQAAGLPCVTANTIEKRSRASEAVYFLSLEDPAQKWAETILQAGELLRQDNLQSMIDAGFDIEIEAKKMQKFFTEA